MDNWLPVASLLQGADQSQISSPGFQDSSNSTLSAPDSTDHKVGIAACELCARESVNKCVLCVCI